MPNWCFNMVDVYGTKEEREKFDEFLIDELTPLSAFIPIPQYFHTMKGFNDGGYEWCLNNWGCKWPENDFEIDISDECIAMKFDSPWGPPIDGYAKISSFFNDLFFCHVWSEEGMQFAGCALYHKGEVAFHYEVGDEEMPQTDWDDDDAVDNHYFGMCELRNNLMDKVREIMLVSFAPTLS